MLPFPRQPIATTLTLMLLSGAIPAVAEEDAVTRGEYLVHAGGCLSCHPVFFILPPKKGAWRRI
jgi:hypothetical protein